LEILKINVIHWLNFKAIAVLLTQVKIKAIASLESRIDQH
jgi:hypothetical protein